MTNIIKKWENPTFLQNGEKLKNKVLPHFVRNYDFFHFLWYDFFMILFFSGYFLMSTDPVSGWAGWALTHSTFGISVNPNCQTQ